MLHGKVVILHRERTGRKKVLKMERAMKSVLVEAATVEGIVMMSNENDIGIMT